MGKGGNAGGPFIWNKNNKNINVTQTNLPTMTVSTVKLANTNHGKVKTNLTNFLNCCLNCSENKQKLSGMPTW